jgi:4-amino-4-deoxy-L-arabinose transferase-like glycosyltransferase
MVLNSARKYLEERGIMDYRSQFPLWFFVGVLTSGIIALMITFLKSLVSNVGTDVSGDDWRMRLVENAPVGVLGLAALGILVGVVAWQRSR